MKINQTELLEKLIHDVNSKCSGLRSAAALLLSSSPEETRELLELMGQQAQALAQSIADCRQKWGV